MTDKSARLSQLHRLANRFALDGDANALRATEQEIERVMNEHAEAISGRHDRLLWVVVGMVVLLALAAALLLIAGLK